MPGSGSENNDAKEQQPRAGRRWLSSGWTWFILISLLEHLFCRMAGYRFLTMAENIFLFTSNHWKIMTWSGIVKVDFLPNSSAVAEKVDRLRKDLEDAKRLAEEDVKAREEAQVESTKIIFDANALVRGLHEQLVENEKSLKSSIGLLEVQVYDLRMAVTNHSVILDAASSGALAVKGRIQTLVDQKDDIYGSGTISYVRGILGGAGNFLIDASILELWNIPDGEGCNDDIVESSVQRTVLEKDIEALREENRKKVQEIIKDQETEDRIREWVRLKAMDVATSIEIPEIPETATHGASLDDIREAIDDRLEIEHADQTGRIDYAGVNNGASVVKTGNRATSPSLVDNLPVLNRLASVLSVRFYGYGPEAALTPTHPPGALGQCWSFEKDPNSKFAGYAILTVRLARRIWVETVSVEHPPKEVTDQRNTAIRQFRLVGFEDPNTEGKAWNLGTFEYKTLKGRRQEFQVTQQVGGYDIPELHVVSLLIDSTWEDEYACLYRFRVHGVEE